MHQLRGSRGTMQQQQQQQGQFDKIVGYAERGQLCPGRGHLVVQLCGSCIPLRARPGTDVILLVGRLQQANTSTHHPGAAAAAYAARL